MSAQLLPTPAASPCCHACATAPAPAVPAPRVLPLFPLYIVSALGLTLFLGISTGAWILFKMAFQTGIVLPSHQQLHAHVQILGFAGLFIFGVALHALPRILGVAPPARAVLKLVLVGIGGGVLLRAVGQPLAPWEAGRLLSLASGALELLGVMAFVAYVVPAVLPAARERDPLAVHVLFGASWVGILALLSGAQSLFLAGHPDPELPGALTESFYVVGVYGFALSFIFGFASKMVRAFLGLPAPRRGALALPLGLQTAGVVLGLAVALRLAPDAHARLGGNVASALVAASGLAFVWGRRILARGIAPAPPALRASSRAIRASFLALGVWSLLLGGAAMFEILTGGVVHKFIWDGARHLFTIGFLTLLVLGMSARVIPAFSGKVLARPGVMSAAFILVGTGAVLRLLQIPVGLGWGGMALYRVVGTMGFFVAAGLILFAWVLYATFRPARSPDALPAVA